MQEIRDLVKSSIKDFDSRKSRRSALSRYGGHSSFMSSSSKKYLVSISALLALLVLLFVLTSQRSNSATKPRTITDSSEVTKNDEKKDNFNEDSIISTTSTLISNETQSFDESISLPICRNVNPKFDGTFALQCATTNESSVHFERLETSDSIQKINANYGLTPDPNNPNFASRTGVSLEKNRLLSTDSSQNLVIDINSELNLEMLVQWWNNYTTMSSLGEP